MIIELPNFVSDEEIKEIKKLVTPFIPEKETYIYNREGRSVYISQTPELKELDNKLLNIFKKVQENIILYRYKPMNPSSDSGYEYHSYGVGQICHFHADGEFAKTFNPEVFKLRYASIILHLNTIENGGELVFPNQNKSVKTEAGKIVIFPPHSTFPHYTTPADVEREVVVTWFTYQDVLLTFQKK